MLCETHKTFSIYGKVAVIFMIFLSKNFMKNLSRIVIILAIVLIVCSALVTCAKKDHFNFEHPDDAWVTDCLMFFSKPTLSHSNDENLAAMFGYSGESGIASEFAAKHDNAINTMYNYTDSDFANNCAYIVYLIYGTDCRGAKPDTYFKLTHLDGERITFDGSDGGIEIGDISAYGDLEATLDMSKAPSERLSVTMTDDTSYGAIVIPIKFNYTNPIGTTLLVDMSVALTRKTVAVDTGEKFLFSNTAEVNPVAEITDISVGYLTEGDYDHGRYSESSIAASTVFKNGSAQYMVLDFKIRTLADNGGSEEIGIITYLSNKNAMAMKIQEAPTGKIDEAAVNDGIMLHSLYSIPEKKGMEKTVRMILKLTPNIGNDVEFDIFVSVGRETVLVGEMHKNLILHLGASS